MTGPWHQGDVVGPTNLNNKLPSFLGTTLGYIFVDNFGAKGDGVTDDTAAINTAEATRTAGQTLKFTPGKTYLCSQTAAANLLKVLVSGTWDWRDATIKYGGATNLTTGGDGGALGLVNVLAANVRLIGTLDGGTKANYPIAIKSQVSGVRVDIALLNVLETNGIWTGIAYGASSDVTGVAISGRAANVAGIVSRASCPIVNTSNTIVGHDDVTAFLYGGTVVNTNSTGFAIVSGGVQWDAYLAKPDTLGIMQTPKQNEDNSHWMDFIVHDLGANVFEIYGHANFADNNWGLGASGGNIGGAFKTGCVTGWYWDNVTQTTANAPNIFFTGGSAQSQGFAHFEGAHLSMRTTGSSGNSSTISSAEIAVVAMSVSSCQLAVRSGNTTYLFNAVATAL